MWERGPRRNNATCLALGGLSVTSSITHKQTGPIWHCSLVVGFVYTLGPCRSLQRPLLWGLEVLLPHPPTGFIRGFEALFPHTATLGYVCLAAQLFLPVYSHANVGPPTPPATALLAQDLQPHLAPSPFHSSCPSLPLLLVWMNVSLAPWLSDFHTVWLSGIYSYFLFLNLLLSFFWLCKKVKCMYLLLHLGQKPQMFYIFMKLHLSRSIWWLLQLLNKGPLNS